MNQMSSPNNMPLDELTRVGVAIREALTDQMVERFAVTGSNAMELLDRLNDEGTNAAVHSLIDRLTEVHKAGALDTVFDLVMAVHALRNALTDQMIERLVCFVESAVTTVANEDTFGLAQGAISALRDAAHHTVNEPVKAGWLGTASLLGKPETQRSLQFLLSFANKLQKHAEDL